MKIAAIIPAAGEPLYSKKFKTLMTIGDGTQTLIEALILRLKEAGIGDIVIVTGYRADLVEQVVSRYGVRVVRNERYAETGMLDSVKLGIAALGSMPDRIFINPSDVPLVRISTLRKLTACGADVCYPVYHGEEGHPVVLSGEAAKRLLQQPGTFGKAIHALDFQPEKIEVEDEGVLLNAKSPDRYRRLISEEAVLRHEGKIYPRADLSIVRTDAFLTKDIARFLRLVESTGSIQGGCSSMNMSYTKGWKIINTLEKELGHRVIERVKGGANGGGSTLTEYGKRVLDAYEDFDRELGKSARALFDVLMADLIDP